MIKKILCIVLCVLCLNSNAQTKVMQTKCDGIPPNFIDFYLPDVQINYWVTYAKTTYKSAPFANYAKRLLGLENIITEDKTVFAIISIKSDYELVKNIEKHYAVEINTKSIAYKINRDNNGFIQSINSDYMPLCVKNRENNIYDFHNDNDTVFNYSCLSQEAIQATSTAKTAEVAAKQILEIRENRLELLSGNSEKQLDGDALKFTVERLDKQEQALLELFTGKKYSEMANKLIIFKPETHHYIQSEDVLFRFSQSLGIVDKDDLAGSPFMINIEGQFDFAQHLIVDSTAKNYNPCRIAIKDFPYNICGNGKFSVYHGNNLLNTIELQVPQFGHIEFLPAKMFNQKTTAVEFTEFGSIKSIK